MEFKVEKLLVNFKTLEEFKQFREYGLQELSMLEELESNMIENNSESPFYGIRFGKTLVARMCLYQESANIYLDLDEKLTYLVLWKLEVLPGYQGKGLGKALVEFAKSFQMPIKTFPKVQSHAFWEKMNFELYSNDTNPNIQPLIWVPTITDDDLSSTIYEPNSDNKPLFL